MKSWFCHRLSRTEFVKVKEGSHSSFRVFSYFCVRVCPPGQLGVWGTVWDPLRPLSFPVVWTWPFVLGVGTRLRPYFTRPPNSLLGVCWEEWILDRVDWVISCRWPKHFLFFFSFLSLFIVSKLTKLSFWVRFYVVSAHRRCRAEGVSHSGSREVPVRQKSGCNELGQ